MAGSSEKEGGKTASHGREDPEGVLCVFTLQIAS